MKNYSETYEYIINYYVERLGFLNCPENIIDRSISILADYYNHLENTCMTPNQIYVYKLAVVDSLLQLSKIPRMFSERVKCAQEVFSMYENEVDVKNFIEWLKKRIEDDKSVIQEVNKSLSKKIFDIINDLTSVQNNIGIFYTEEIDPAISRLECCLKDRKNWLN